MKHFASFRSKVASTYHDNWSSDRYPDFVTEGTGDQKAIMEAICKVKKASFDGVDCVGGDDAATGTVRPYAFAFLSCRFYPLLHQKRIPGTWY